MVDLPLHCFPGCERLQLNLSIDRLNGGQFSKIFSRLDVLQELTLNVHDSYVDKATVRTIAQLTNLRSLQVTSTDILEVDVRELAVLAKLERLNVLILNREVTAQEVARFATIVPTLKKTVPSLKTIIGPSGAVFLFP